MPVRNKIDEWSINQPLLQKLMLKTVHTKGTKSLAGRQMFCTLLTEYSVLLLNLEIGIYIPLQNEREREREYMHACVLVEDTVTSFYKVPVHNFKCFCQYVCLCMFMCICALIISCHTNFEFDLLRSRSKHTNITLSLQISAHFSIALARQHIKSTVKYHL